MWDAIKRGATKLPQFHGTQKIKKITSISFVCIRVSFVLLIYAVSWNGQRILWVWFDHFLFYFSFVFIFLCCAVCIFN